MSAQNHLYRIVRTVHGATRRLLDDVTEEESLVTVPGCPNHIRWLAGHLVTGTAMALAAAGAPVELPAGWPALFERGAPVAADAGSFPPMREIRDRLYADHARLQDALRRAKPEELERENEIQPGWKQNATDAVHFFTVHEFYHAGQIAMVRRALGRAGAFG